MADPKGFLTTPRETPARRPVDLRILDWREVYEPFPPSRLERQAGRCMDCGIPFCHNGCPLGNLIPEWNDLVWRHDWREAAERLHATNNFPEFTGRLCPAPCEAACVLGINADPVTIKQVEVEIIDRAFASGWVVPRPPAARSGRTVAVIGSGPAGLAAAQQLTRAGHAVTVFERADAPGGLLRYGIPEFKMEKRHLDRRLDQMRAEGTEFRCGVEAGTDVTAAELRARLRRDRAGRRRPGAARPAAARARPGRRPPGHGVPAAGQPGRRGCNPWRGPAEPAISARGRHVVIIGGGDTGADCLGTAHRQGAASVTQLEILPRPPATRPGHQPWPTYPMIYRVSSAHEEGGERVYAVSTQEFLGDDAGPGAGAAAGRGGPGSTRCPAPSASCPATWCCWPWASPARSGRGCSPTSAWTSTPRGNVGPGRLVRDVGARRVRGRRHGPRPVADRLGHRRGPQRRRRRRPLPGRDLPPARADPAHRPSAYLIYRAKCPRLHNLWG